MVKKADKAIKIVSERGVAVHPRLNSPDTHFNKDGVFSVDLRFEPSNPKHAQFLAKLGEHLDAAVEKEKEKLSPREQKNFDKDFGINPIIRDEINKDTDEETGYKLVKFSSYATKKDPNDETKLIKKVLKFLDSKNVPIAASKVPNIGGGSELQVAATISAYNKNKKLGIKLYIDAIKIHTVEEWSSTPDFGDSEDGGYTVGADSSDDYADNGSTESGDF